jgi:ADP-heptose:LPS heptosyltransferase
MLKKRLPAPKFSALIENIYRDFKIKCVLLGGAEEAGLRDEIKSRAAHAFLDISPRDLQELGYVIQHAAFFMGNDSGLMHIAVALNRKCIVFFGPSDEVRTGPYFLSREEKDKSVSRGHLLIRHEKQAPPQDNQKDSVNPRLRYSGSTGLERLDIDPAWEKMESFIREILLPCRDGS